VGGLSFCARIAFMSLEPAPAIETVVPERYNKSVRARFLTTGLVLFASLAWGQAASDKAPSDDSGSATSSSRETRVDLTPPKDDAKLHPESKLAVADLDGSAKPDKPDTTGIQEFHPWNPMKALKDIEVGDFYFKRKNYRAALDRYKEALYYKDGDAVASYKLAVCQEKLGDKAEAKKYYEQYLKVLPEGPFAKDAHASLDRLAKAR
jgi:tetratricopeptide (TPR) repeat protein